jgi:hypothetical protein
MALPSHFRSFPSACLGLGWAELIFTLGPATIELQPASCRSCSRSTVEASLPLSLIDNSTAVFDTVVWSLSEELTCNDNEIDAVGISGRDRGRGERPDCCCDSGSKRNPKHHLSR